MLNEKIHLYMAEDITFVDQSLDEDEFLEVERVPLAELYRAVLAGEIEDSKTQVAVMKAVHLRGRALGIEI